MGETMDVTVEEQSEAVVTATGVSQPQWYKQVSLEDAKVFIRSNLAGAARNFIAIGYYLKRVRDGELYREDGHETIWDFAMAEYGISKSTASRYMSMNDRFSQGGNSPLVDDQYKNFDKSKLQEMLSLTDDQMERVTPDNTVQEIRELRKPREIPYFELEGQMDLVTDFPNVLPASEPQVQSQLTQPRVFTIDVADLIDSYPAPRQEEVATSQRTVEQKSTEHSIDDLDLSVNTYNCLKKAEINTIEQLQTMTDDELVAVRQMGKRNMDEVKQKLDKIDAVENKVEEQPTDLDIARDELEQAQRLLSNGLVCMNGDRTDIHIRRLIVKVAALACYIEELKERDRWIPVEERMPKEPKPETDLTGLPEYIVTIFGAEMSTVLKYVGEKCWWDEETENYYHVVAWMPMPEPYCPNN